MSAFFDRGELRTISFEAGEERSYWAGHAWQLGTARYWETVADESPTPSTYRLGASLLEEVGACVIGGFGMTWETVHPYLSRLSEEGVFGQDLRFSVGEIEALLREPVTVNGTLRRYRFPAQRAARLSGALRYVSSIDADSLDDRELRDALRGAPGIGFKTASWIVRNLRASDSVAIIDIHIARAGTVAGVFDPAWRVERDYRRIEEAFLAWSKDGGTSPAKLDAVIWAALSGPGQWSREILGFHASDHSLIAVWPT